MKLKLGILAQDFTLDKSYVFDFGRIRTLVAMATYSFHRLIMGKVEIGNFYRLIGDNRIDTAKSLGIFDFFFTKMFIE